MVTISNYNINMNILILSIETNVDFKLIKLIDKLFIKCKISINMWNFRGDQ